MNTTNLINRLNAFDNYYQMTEDHGVWTKWANEERSLRVAINPATPDQIKEIVAGLNENGKNSDIGMALIAYLDKLPKEKSKLSKVMTAAWAMLKEGLFDTMSDALKAAWKRIKLLASLRSGICYFSYINKEGERRDAVGTLRDGNYSYESKNANQDIKYHVVKYYDIVKQGFRSCRVDRLITVS